MRNIHIAFFSIPHAAHVNATLPIISALVRRGYRVTYVTSERFASRARSLGAEAVCCNNWADAESEREPMFDDHPRITVFNMNGICRAGIRILAEVGAFYESERPDVIIYDQVAFAGRLLARRWSIPAIQISPDYALDKDDVSAQIRNEDFREWVLAQGKKADRFFERYGIGNEEFIFQREGLSIYSFPRVFQPEGAATSDDRCFFSGRCAAEQPYYGDWKKTHRDGKPIALISTSTTYVRDPDYFKTCIAALSGLNWHLVLSIGENNDPAALEPLPPNVEIVQHTAHIKILPHAGLLIFQGGNLSAVEAAYHGVPMIAATFGFAELEWFADTNIVRLGLGVHLREGEFDAERVRDAAIRIANDPEIRRNVRRMSRIVQREPGAEEVANRIDDYLETQLARDLTE